MRLAGLALGPLQTQDAEDPDKGLHSKELSTGHPVLDKELSPVRINKQKSNILNLRNVT